MDKFDNMKNSTIILVRAIEDLLTLIINLHLSFVNEVQLLIRFCFVKI
jgi:hypothetical protein